MKPFNKRDTMCKVANKIQGLLIDNNYEIVEGPNSGNHPCLWLVEKGEPYHKGVYICHK